MPACSPTPLSSGARRALPGVSLPVLASDARSDAGHIKPSRNARRRAGVLIAVHALFAIHIAHWLTRGRTISPVEPSESMRTLEFGEINAGVLFFAAAILATLVFGRFFCGWGCHVVAIQDLCAWLLKRIGIRPKVFRSRLLVYIPLGLALYMFLWPTLKRAAVAPLLEPVWPDVRRHLGVAPFPIDGFSNHVTTEEFWATFPGVLVAIPFLLICGFACVYFLGAKGFCTYGCPYGGIFGPIDRISVGRIVVDPQKCHQCGHCTGVCTSNVRVHEEIRDFGMVVNPGCMKCMDCVSVCPNGALQFQFARPSLAAGSTPRARSGRVFDTSRTEDFALVAVFVAVVLCVRGAYEIIPLLMAVGIGCCAIPLSWKAWRLARDRDVRLGMWQLKRAGGLTAIGAVYVSLLSAAALLVAHTGLVNYHRWRGDAAFEALALTRAALLAPDAPRLDPSTEPGIRVAIGHYDRASGFLDSRGGIGIVGTTGAALRAGLLHLAMGNASQAESLLRSALTHRADDDEITADLSRLIWLQGGRDSEALALLELLVRRAPASWRCLEQLAEIRVRRREPAIALDLARQSLAALPSSPRAHAARGRILLTSARLQAADGDPRKALELLAEAADLRTHDSVILENYAAALERLSGDLAGALEQLDRAIAAAPGRAELRLQKGRMLLAQDDRSSALESLDAAIVRAADPAAMRVRVAAMLRQSGLEAEARAREP